MPGIPAQSTEAAPSKPATMEFHTQDRAALLAEVKAELGQTDGNEEETPKPAPKRPATTETREAGDETEQTEDDDSEDDEKTKAKGVDSELLRRAKLRKKLPPSLQYEVRRMEKELRDQASEQVRQQHQEIAQIAQQLEQRYGRYDQGEAALKAGDPDRFAQAFGFETWEKLNSEFISILESPAHRRIAELERERAIERQQREADQRRMYEQQQREQLTRSQQEWVNNLTKQLKESDDELVSSLATEEPEFVNVVFHEQGRLYQELAVPNQRMDQATIDYITQEATKRALDRHQQRYAKLSKVFGDRTSLKSEMNGDRAAVKHEKAGDRPTTKAEKKTRTAIPLDETTGAQALPDTDDLNELRAAAVRAMKAANARG